MFTCEQAGKGGFVAKISAREIALEVLKAVEGEGGTPAWP
jgi:hypothetical protein